MLTDAECRCENPDTCARCRNEAAEHFAEQAAKELAAGREAAASLDLSFGRVKHQYRYRNEDEEVGRYGVEL